MSKLKNKTGGSVGELLKYGGSGMVYIFVRAVVLGYLARGDCLSNGNRALYLRR